jgi:hypothetical protein
MEELAVEADCQPKVPLSTNFPKAHTDQTRLTEECMYRLTKEDADAKL